MKSKIEFTKADESSFDGTKADRYSADEVAFFSQHEAKPHVIRSVCDWHLPTIVGYYYTECPTCGFLTIEVKQTDV